ncbi:MAG: ABC transporter permease subunit [Acidaminobacter sp.]|uniref:ABC transporter permease n=1 Tax=Acidaminobacter sp. TaxID=1872102 RepID=UPI00137E36E0|nr:iron ABC transporter permease [Acidaminobacter sp.]MZQ98983.1 ABC transporter permease subunit [Acidaminobacter sp.]
MTFGQKRRKVGAVIALAFLCLILISLPVLAILFKIELAATPEWLHFKEFLLKDTVYNTVYLIVFSLLFSAVLGVLAAVSVALFDFPLKRFFKWFFYMPLAIPPYIAAYVFAGMTGYTGVIQRTLRTYEIPFKPEHLDLMNLRGAVLIYAITLFPYVYGPVRAFLEYHAGGMIEVSRVHGHSPVKIFLKVILPLVRLPMVGGLTLIMMEILGDYGVVRYFNIRTVSSAIFSSWFGSGTTAVALRLSFYMMLLIVVFQGFESFNRSRRRYHMSGQQPRLLEPIPLKGMLRYGVTLGLLIVSLVVFLIPVGQMAVWSVKSYSLVRLDQLFQIIYNTLFYSILASLIILAINLLIVQVRRWQFDQRGKLMDQVVQMGYAIPGAIIAIGAMVIFVGLDKWLYPVYVLFNPESKRLILSTSTVLLVYAFVVRYMAAGYNSVHSGFSKIGIKYSEAASTLGKGRFYSLVKVELPMVKTSLISGFLLTFIDILKELPLTLLLRPYNFNTLASRAYEYANDERIMEASVPALMIVSLSVAALLIFAGIHQKKYKRTQEEVKP